MTSHDTASTRNDAPATAFGVSTDAMLEDLRTLVEIESPSRDPDALAVAAAGTLENVVPAEATVVVDAMAERAHLAAGLVKAIQHAPRA